MNPLRITEDIVSVGELEADTRGVLRRLRESHRAIVLTEGDRPAAVLITAEEFDRFCENERFTTAVRRGLADSEAGRMIDDEDLERELDARFGSADGT